MNNVDRLNTWHLEHFLIMFPCCIVFSWFKLAHSEFIQCRKKTMKQKKKKTNYILDLVPVRNGLFARIWGFSQTNSDSISSKRKCPFKYSRIKWLKRQFEIWNSPFYNHNYAHLNESWNRNAAKLSKGKFGLEPHFYLVLYACCEVVFICLGMAK